MAHRSQCSSVGDNPLDPNYLPPHYREEYRLAIDALVENDIDGYYNFLQNANVVDFLSRPEIEHIKNTVQLPQSVSSVPELPYRELDQEGSSDTYWPLHSDLDAPGLDLGWPLRHHSFVGPTEVTTLVNPSDPEMPSIKEQARRLIKNAQQVIAVVMDMFTDVDIFADLLDAAARHVPVYVLLDEQNAHHFIAMVTTCKVNLDMIHMMRVRTVAGITYFCRTGKSFKGQVMDRFLLADCRAVLSGNYSFMWSFEKIHRCIAHLFLGELVATFDEEFRILFAQSQPLVVENALVPMPTDSTSSYLSNQFGLKRTQSLRNPRGFLRQSELSAYSFGDRVDAALPFRRDDPFRHTIEPGGAAMQVSKFASHQFRMQQSFLEQGRSMIASQQLEMNAYKRHSYAEGTRESYSSSRQYMKHRVMNNLEEMEAHYQRDQHFYQGEGTGPEPGHGRYDPLRSYGLPQLDQYSDPMYPPELEPPGSQNVLSSEDLRHDPGNKHQAMAHYGPPNQKRPTLGQAYACQSSPTQLHPPDHKQMFSTGEQGKQSQDPSVKQGLRSWRINSYLSAYEDAGEEGLQQPMGTDAFEEPQQQAESRQYLPEVPGIRISSQESINIPSKPKLDFQPRFGKPILPERDKERDVSAEWGSAGTDSQMKPAISATSLTSVGTDSEKEADTKEPREISITKHESFRSRINPMLQRSSRLRSSLIFSSSKLEQHSSTLVKPGGKLQEEDENNSIRTSSIVAEILEKRRSLSREPFDWNKHKKTDEKVSKGLVAGEVTFKPEEEPARDTKDNMVEPKDPVSVDRDTTLQTEPSMPKLTSLSLNVNDPASRLQYFKELSAKRRDSKTGSESVIKSQEPLPKKPDLSDTPPSTTATVTAVSGSPAEPTPATSVMQTDPAAKPPVVTTKSKPSELSVDKIHSDESTEAAKKETAKEPKSLKPFPSPKFFKKDTLKPFKASHSRRTSCGEDILTDATDAEKSELKKSRSLSSSSMTRTESKESLSLNRHSSNTSLNTVGSEGKDTKALDFLKKQTQRLKGILGPKGDKKNAGVSSTVEDKQMKTVPEMVEEPSPKRKETEPEVMSTSAAENPKPINKPSQSRYQSSTSTVLFSSNLRDDTKVILEQISANSQKNRQELTKQAEECRSGEGENEDHVSDHDSSQRYQSRNRFGRTPVNPQERDSLLKRIESMRKEKKVYSRFEMGNNLG
ncbi:protein FAM83H [Colossoma macropomum]|uniref:protein FAM83H n=1 Tax=Colossoma macropomum TaxID=42526 RepID=UPI0018646C6B|nr:protein FAM83H [Colossoma macropomum]